MADEPQNTTVEQQPEETSAPPAEPQGMGFDLDAAHKAAEEFLAQSRQEETAEPTRERDEHGRFKSKAAAVPAQQPDTPTPFVHESQTPRVDPAWVEAAKVEGFSEAEIGTFTSDDDVQTRIAVRRLQNLQRAGITPQDYLAFQQWRQQGSQPQPAQTQQTPQPTVATTLDDLNLNIDENELAPEVAGQLKAMNEYVNKLKATLVGENQKLRQQVDTMEQATMQQRAAVEQAQREAQWAREWDAATDGTPFASYFGKPSELKRISDANPNDQRVLDLVGFRAYFDPAYDRYSKTLGHTAQALKLAVRDAWQASPFSRLNGNGNANRNNGTGNANGSVVRQSATRRSPAEQYKPDSAGDFERGMDVVKQAFADNGGINPFRMSD